MPLLLAFVLLLGASMQAAAQALMPMPSEVAWGNARLVVTPSFRASLQSGPEPRIERAVQRFLDRLAVRTRVRLESAPAPVGPNEGLQIRGGAAPDDESYSLHVTAKSVMLEAPGPLGILRGLETLLQLASEGGIATASIKDRPRYSWRGLMLDVSRHFMPIEAVRRQIDAMAVVKLNVFHWHLSDDQGIRVESKLFPRLQTHGSDGKFYTQTQIRQLVEYARDRGIRIVPEFDLPGHTSAILAAYPSLASAPGQIPIAKTWTMLSPVMDPTRDEVYTFIEKFFGEMTSLFPDRYFHMGGDEVNGTQWRTNLKIQAFAKENAPGGKAAIHAYFNKRLSDILTSLNRVMVGWDEILHPDLPPATVIQSWRGAGSLLKANREGYRGILSNGFYLDHMKPASYHYANDPGDGERLLGGEACMWAEYVTDENVDMRIWPRMAAIAERLWSPASVRDVESMYQRLQAVSAQLTEQGLQHEASRVKMLGRLAGKHPVPPLEILSNALEPVKMYARSTSRAYTTATPMNRLVDSIPPESLFAHYFAQSVESALGGDAAARKSARGVLAQWRDNHRAVLSVLQSNPILNEIVPLATYVRDVAAAGVEAIDANAGGVQPSAEWYGRVSKLLDTEGKRVPPLATQRSCTATLMQYGRRLRTVRKGCAEPRYLEELVPVIVEPVRRLVESVRPSSASRGSLRRAG